MALRVGVIGATGQIGRYLTRIGAERSGLQIVPLGHEDLEITRADGVAQALAPHRLDVLVNTSAAHGPTVESALDEAFAVNAIGPQNLAAYCLEHGIDLVHFSTDYVFKGDAREPYGEDDRPEPLSAYGISKLAGELFVRAILPNHYIVRVSAVFGVGGCRAKGNLNFVELMLGRAATGDAIRVVEDQFVSPTYARDVADAVLTLVATRAYGTYHLTNAGACSWFEFAREIFRQAGVEARLDPSRTDITGAGARRPLYSVLDNRRWRSLGFADLRSWQQALTAYLAERR